jgi:thermitase
MKIVFRTLILCSLVALVLLCRPAFAGPMVPDLTRRNSPSYVPDEVLVKFRTSVASFERKASITARSGALVADLGMGGWTRVKAGAGQTVDQAIAAYQNDPNVEVVQPNFIYHIAAVPNDPSYNQLWAFKNTGQIITGDFTQPPGSALTYTLNNPGTAGDDMNIEPAWDLITDCSGTYAVVAVIDTGVNYNQQDLSVNMWSSPTYPHHGFNFVDNNSDPMDKHGHGTHVAGIIGASGNNSLGTTGVCWKASIMAIRVLDASGSGTTATITQGVNFAVAQGAKVINMSIEGVGADPALSSAITAALNKDVVVVVAAGNEGANNNTTATYPCNYTQKNLICVAALDQSYQLANFSNYGTISVDVGAPGANILSTWAGTSGLITDMLNSGWTFTTTTSGGWASKQFAVSSVLTGFLVDPSNFPNGTYKASTDDRVYKSFDLTGQDAASLQFVASIDVISGDYFRVGYKAAGGDPFSGGTIALEETNLDTNLDANLYVILLGADVSDCISANCSIGFQLKSVPSFVLKGKGVALSFLDTLPGMSLGIETLALNTSSYNTINGTSMAAPEVAGLAAMLRAYNPEFTAMDVVNAIKNGGRPTPSLANKTSTGNAIDVMSSLVYINPPTGLKAVVK